VSEVWITHPQLTPGHDIKVLKAALGSYVGSGWQVRADQSDPPPAVPEPADPRLAASPSPAPSGSRSPRKES
jgi:hypothetical protein